MIPRKRIDFILRACAGLKNVQKEKSIEQKPAKITKEENCISAEGGEERFSSRSSRSSVQTLNSVDWRLLIIGEGPEQERLGALATELGIADRVHFLGLRNDVREILADCDIYLHASKAETCTYAVTESMAAGIPAVMLNAGAAKEQIENGVTGFVFDEVDTVPFATCLSDLMGDSVRRAEMGRLAKSRWEARFRIERAAARYHEMYGKLTTDLGNSGN